MVDALYLPGDLLGKFTYLVTAPPLDIAEECQFELSQKLAPPDPVLWGETVYLVAGADYRRADARALRFNVISAAWAARGQGLASVRFIIENEATLLVEGVFETTTGGLILRFELSAAQTRELALISGVYFIEARTLAGDQLALAQGLVELRSGGE